MTNITDALIISQRSLGQISVQQAYVWLYENGWTREDIRIMRITKGLSPLFRAIENDTPLTKPGEIQEKESKIPWI